MPEALPLVTFNQNSNNFATNLATLEVLAGVPEPLAVVSIAGLFRTGKSFLLNRVILHTPSARTSRRTARAPTTPGFGVGNTVQAHTKGIWMWSEPLVVQDANGANVNVIVMDTEGSGAPSADATHDARVSSLGLLLSSYFVYNSTGRIDDAALSTLTTVTHVTSEMREEDAGELPGFLWVLRDFALQLENKDGVAVDPDTYMEEQLSGEKNDARAHLRKYFKDRGCATLVRPVMQESELQNLNELSDNVLRPEFVEAAAALRKRILTAAANRPLTHNNTLLNGGMLTTLVTRYVAAVNEGAVPHIADAWESVCTVRAAEAERAMLSQFPITLNKLLVEATTTTHVMVADFREVAYETLTNAWGVYEQSVSAFCKPTPELKTLLTEQVETAITRYEVAWTERVGGAARAVVENLAADVANHDTWSSFWKLVQTHMQEFENKFGRHDATTLLLLRAAQRLWEVVPVFFGDVPFNAVRIKEMEKRISELEEDAATAERTSAHEMDAIKLRMEGADKRVAAAEEENKEMSVALTKAQEEVRGMMEEVMEAQQMRGEIESMSARVREMEDALTTAEDEAARKASEAHVTALKSVEAVKELRMADSKRYEAELAAMRTNGDTIAQELNNMKQEHANLTARARTASERVAALTSELEEANNKALAANREMRSRDESTRAMQIRMTELERQVAEADERARKRPRVTEGDALKLVRVETELGFLRTQKNDLATALTNSKARCTDLERQIRTVQRTADETVQRERLQHETTLAQMEMRIAAGGGTK